MRKIELAIIGGGIGGISCAIYAKRAGLSPVIFDKSSLGGQLSFINKIDNYPGLNINTNGSQLLDVLTDTIKELNIELIKEEVTRVEKEKEINIFTENNSYTSQSLVIATGATFKRLDIEGEREFSGKGVSWCAICDGYFFKNKEVAVVGGGNTALEEAIYLSSICKKVYLIHRRNKLRALDYLQKELSAKSNIEIIWNSVVVRVEGKDVVEKIVLNDLSQNKDIDLMVSGLFIAIGIKPNGDIFKGFVDVDEDGFILTNEKMMASQEGVYACGDCRKRPLRQLITAAAEGSVAALSAYHYLRNSYISY